MGDTIEEKFRKKYGEGNWVRIRKYIKKGLTVTEIEILLFGVVSYDTINRIVKKIRGGDK